MQLRPTGGGGLFRPNPFWAVAFDLVPLRFGFYFDSGVVDIIVAEPRSFVGENGTRNLMELEQNEYYQNKNTHGGLSLNKIT